MSFSQRLIQPELLDHLPPDQARPNLADIARLNRNFGGHSVVRKTLRQALGAIDRFTLLDVGCASGDIARMIRESYPAARITCLDCNQLNLESAPPPKLQADAFSLPFRSETFDFVLSAMLLHHFTDENVTVLLRELYRVARKALLICDLERRLIPYIFLPATKLLFRWTHVTVHDGVRSVRASFRPKELLMLASDAGIKHSKVQVHRPAYRVSLISNK